MTNSGLSIRPKFFLIFLLLSGLIFFFRCQPGEDGTGGPILVISDVSKNPFSRYSIEILRAEGFNEFDVTDINDLTPRVLASYDIILLGNIPVTASQVTLFTNWVNDGGTFILFRPDSQLYSLSGIIKSGKGIMSDKYILIDKNTEAGAGIVNETLQYHGDADTYFLNGASSLATLYHDADKPAIFPAVTANTVGSGHVITFAYDLARSIVYTRQGNPAWQSMKRDGTAGPTRSDDLFFGGVENDSLPDYIDFHKIAIPQADEQQRFLANIMLQFSQQGKPLPRFWYLPKKLKAAIVMTGDDHNFSGTPLRFDEYLKAGPNTPDDIKNWNAVRATSYIYPDNPMSDEQVKYYQQQGFEIALHLSTHCLDWTPKQLDDEWVAQPGNLREKYPDLETPVTSRTHCMCWSDWASQAKIQALHGVRLDVNYYYWPGEWVKNRAGMFTGSGLPMRFADLDGSIIDCYQAPTQMTDESVINYATFVNTLLDNAIGKEGYYGTFVANMHTDRARHRGSEIIVAAAKKRDIPVISARQLLTWLDGRSNSSFGSLTWNGNKLSFYILAASGSDNLNAMLPVTFQNKKLVSVIKNDKPVQFTTEVIKGVNYAFFDGITGNYTAIYQQDRKGPVIDSIKVLAHQDGTATVTWKTDEPADSRIDYGIAGLHLSSVTHNAFPKTHHSLKLTGLFADTKYQFRVSCRDEAGNMTTENTINREAMALVTPGPVLIEKTAFPKTLIKPNANSVYVPDANSGGITLKPLAYQHFPGRTLPADMETKQTLTGFASVAGGFLKLDGANVYTRSMFKPGMSLEFEAVFNSEARQAIGFAIKNEFDSASVTVGTSDSLNGIYAIAGKNRQMLLLYASEFNKPHRYRIEWKATRFVFFVDGIESVTMEHVIADSMHVLFHDPVANKLTLQANWFELSPFTATTAIYESEIFDAGSVKNWNMISWRAQTSGLTDVKVFCRYGNSARPGNNWTPFLEVANNTNPGMKSRFIQYRVNLSTTDLNFSPTFGGINISGSAIQ